MIGRGWCVMTRRRLHGLAFDAGVYAIFDESGLLYIGQSAALSSRLITHPFLQTADRGQRHVRACAIPDRAARVELERKLIRRLRPPLNGSGMVDTAGRIQVSLRLNADLWLRVRCRAIGDGRTACSLLESILAMAMGEPDPYAKSVRPRPTMCRRSHETFGPSPRAPEVWQEVDRAHVTRSPAMKELRREDEEPIP